FAAPTGIVLGGGAEIFVSDRDALGGNGAVIRLDRVTGVQTVISAGGNFIDPNGLALGADGFLMVSDARRGILRVNPLTGSPTILSSGGLFANPAGITVVTDVIPEPALGILGLTFVAAAMRWSRAPVGG